MPAARQGAVGDDDVQFACEGKAPELPDDLIPATPQEPRAIGICLGIGAYSVLCLREALGIVELDLGIFETQIDHVAVRIDQPGQQRLATAVNGFGAGKFLVQGCSIAGLDHLAQLEHQPAEVQELIAGERITLDILHQRWRAAGLRRDDQAEDKRHYSVFEDAVHDPVS
jgi:hypothetical protein